MIDGEGVANALSCKRVRKCVKMKALDEHTAIEGFSRRARASSIEARHLMRVVPKKQNQYISERNISQEEL